ncbi:hypothetical protein MTR62_05495 [Novosphingobium sp. 1949]|uniref:Methylamine utilization protein MauE n=1 Tax=Novosphingobium organovorum TaxID=2930092 RepID=A0ABT0BAS2_9SPHN|nr:MauE/DoxX family redox-associated membrane protein [Novosphingobium organovorum]MCJ2182155.1 hypothetical protein [Novosphingobium organovorum]
MPAEMPAAMILAARGFGALLFGASALGKGRNLGEFAAIIARHVPLAGRGSAALAGAIIAIEGLCAVFLASGVASPVGGVLGIVLLLGFALVMARALRRGERDLDCGCRFGAARQAITWPLVWRNLVFAAALFPALARWAQAPGRLEWIDGLGAGAAMFVLAALATQLIHLHDRTVQLQQRFS